MQIEMSRLKKATLAAVFGFLLALLVSELSSDADQQHLEAADPPRGAQSYALVMAPLVSIAAVLVWIAARKGGRTR